MKINLIIKEMGYDGVDWIYLAEVKVQKWAFMNTVMNLLVSQKAGDF
jgi:hypothetical protein